MSGEGLRCSCGNRFDGDNLCMVSACQWEGIDRTPEAVSGEGLTAFLLARIAEDVETAEDAVPAGWVTFRNPDGSMGHTALGTPEEDGWLVDGRMVQDERAEVFYDPARVLAECEAKRRIVERHVLDTVTDGHPMARRNPCIWCDDHWPYADLRDLALPYADHDEFREEWKP